jgi:hypothetical protein
MGCGLRWRATSSARGSRAAGHDRGTTSPKSEPGRCDREVRRTRHPVHFGAVIASIIARPGPCSGRCGVHRCAPQYFYVRASDGSVTLPAAGYNYGGNWVIPPAGLSPAGLAASLAAPTLGSGWWPAFAGRDWRPAGTLRGFPSFAIRSSLPPSPGFAWRNTTIANTSQPGPVGPSGHPLRAASAARHGGCCQLPRGSQLPRGRAVGA